MSGPTRSRSASVLDAGVVLSGTYRFATGLPAWYRETVHQHATECDDLRKSCFCLADLDLDGDMGIADLLIVVHREGLARLGLIRVGILWGWP